MNYTIRLGTEVTRKILDNLGSPDDKLNIIHIAGTNGKGSTAEFFTNIIIAAGHRVGTFTSPEVYDYYDQFRIDGEPIGRQKFSDYLRAAQAAADGLNATQFELETAAVIYAFAEEHCSYAVIECGMGGLTDATNAVNKKALAVITSISLEHTAYLGDTVEKICAQKAGIIKNCPVVINAHQPREAEEYFKKLGYPLCKTYTCGLSAVGSLQIYNASSAIEGAKLLGFGEAAIYEGVKNTAPRGRLEIFNACGREYILDGAHNPAAFEPLRDLLKQYDPKEVTIVFGCLSDKDADGNLKFLQGLADKIIAVQCPSPRALPLDNVAAVCKKYFGEVVTCVSISAAMNSASSRTVAVCGSFTLLRETKLWIENLTAKKQ